MSRGDSDAECPANGEKTENGLIEAAGKTTREYVCTFLSQIDDGIDDKLPLGANIIPWIVRWGSDMIFKVRR